jgi:pimeloyl-ACP methyl ester carboxylesterase
MYDQYSADGQMSFDDVGGGPVVVLLHAFPLSRKMWRLQVEALAPRFRCIAPDLRGFGGSVGFDGTPSVEQMADDVASLLDEERVPDRVVLGGLSMGGYAALAFARRHGDRLRGLFLADTKADPDDATARAGRDKSIAFMRDHTARDLIEQAMDRMLSSQTRERRPEVVEEVRAIAGEQTPAGITGALRALRDRPDARPSLGNITVPTLVIVGSDDALTPPARARELQASIVGARLVEIPGAGHLSNLEQPAAFTQALGAFLRELV